MRNRRRDNRGRTLYVGEYQQREGRYMFRYRDETGKYRTIYSWRLTASDRQPFYARPCRPLREMEHEIYMQKGII